MDPKGVVQAFVEAVNHQDWQAIETLVTPNFASTVSLLASLVCIVEGPYSVLTRGVHYIP
jgi:hypothetical protein